MELALVILLAAFIIYYPRKDSPAETKGQNFEYSSVDFTFNGNQEKEMVLDIRDSTGTINNKAVDNLKIKPMKEEEFIVVARGKVEKFSVGSVNSREVKGGKVDNAEVALLNSNNTIVLLGHNSFKEYDVTIKRETIEFNKPSE